MKERNNVTINQTVDEEKIKQLLTYFVNRESERNVICFYDEGGICRKAIDSQIITAGEFCIREGDQKNTSIMFVPKEIFDHPDKFLELLLKIMEQGSQYLNEKNQKHLYVVTHISFNEK